MLRDFFGVVISLLGVVGMFFSIRLFLGIPGEIYILSYISGFILGVISIGAVIFGNSLIKRPGDVLW